MSWVTQTVLRTLARRGFVVQRHPARRRQALLTEHGVDVVFDVGASDGGFARELREFGYDGRIVSFEPLSDAYARLRSHSDPDPAWIVRHTALGEARGGAQINVASNSTSSSILPMERGHTDAAPHVSYVATESIQVARLDDEAPEHLSSDARPFLKLDTQGFEAQVLAGGPETLGRCVGVQLELSFVPLYAGGMLVDEAITTMYDAGFSLTSISQGFTSPAGPVLQADGVFFRRSPETPRD